MALDGDAEVMRYLTGRARARAEVLEEWLPVMSRDAGTDGRLGYWAGIRARRLVQMPAVRARNSGVGDQSPTRIRRVVVPQPGSGGRRDAELGYRLRRDAWSHGYATEGALALLAYGFDAVGLEHGLWAQTDGTSTGWRRRAVMERIGLAFERTWVGEWNEPLPRRPSRRAWVGRPADHQSARRACRARSPMSPLARVADPWLVA